MKVVWFHSGACGFMVVCGSLLEWGYGGFHGGVKVWVIWGYFCGRVVVELW